MDRTDIRTATIGYAGHGKTTLTAALAVVLDRAYGGNATSNASIENPSEEKARGVTFEAPHIQYNTAARHYDHTDYPNNDSFVKDLVTSTHN